MIYNLLKDMQKFLEAKSGQTSEEKQMLSRINGALHPLLHEGDNEHLAVNEVLVRICPDTGHPVLVCHNGEGECLCLHNDTVEEDAVDVNLWLSSSGKQCNGNRRLLEAVADIAYNAGADNLCENNDSRTVVTSLIKWAGEFEELHADTDWDESDYLQTIDEFYKEKVSVSIKS